jgi:hypothetical protein
VRLAIGSDGDKVSITQFDFPTATWGLDSNAVFRDYSAWYHFVFVLDTTQATASNRFKFYVNNVLQTLTQRSGYSSAYPAQNAEPSINTTNLHEIGRSFNGYLADIHFIDGQALDPTSFGEFDATTGVWVPIEYTGSYGTNGGQLKFEDNSSNTATTLGKDTSGNGNNWTPNNLSIVTGGPTSVAAASGALPIFNTTDTYGTTKGTGTRTDSNSSSIVLAIPMDGANNGTTFTDEHATIKGSGSAKSITRNGDTKTSTAQSKFYGSSGFFDGTNDYLQIGNSTDFNYTTSQSFTFEMWLYGQNATRNFVVGSTSYNSGTSSYNAGIRVDWSPGTNFVVQVGTGSVVGSNLSTNTWHHVAYVYDAAAQTTKLYINGVQNGSTTTGTQSLTSTGDLLIGVQGSDLILDFQGYIQDFRIYKGVAKYTSNFNPPSSTQNATIAVGNDSLVDVPTNGAQTDTGAGGEVRGNYATLNPLENSAGRLSYADGNLQASVTIYDKVTLSTFELPLSGKWYWEDTVNTVGFAHRLGLFFGVSQSSGDGFTTIAERTHSQNGNKFDGSTSSSYGSSFTTGDIIGVAVDMDNGAIYFSKNGTWQNSGVPTSGASKTGAAFTDIVSLGYSWRIGTYINSGSVVYNFGQRPFAYTAPSGFKALNTANLPAPVVTKPSDLFDVKLYTGNGSTQTISGLGFSPDLVWTKARSFAENNNVFDAVRGATKLLLPDQTNAEQTISGITAFNSDGYTVGSHVSCNSNGQTYVSWNWDAGSSTVTNTQGSISSQVRANASAGFSIVTYTGNGSNGATVGHGLGVSPSMIFYKRRSATEAWIVYHNSLTLSQNLVLNTTGAVASNGSLYWNTTAPTSTVFSLGTDSAVNTNTSTYVAYCFAPVAGYSSGFSYTGNGSADGVFQYLGFRPRLILLKCSSTTGNWTLVDTARLGYNVDNNPLFPNLSNAEGTTDLLDITSNGFKLRTTDASVNSSGATYVGFAWAESPFNYSRAR